MFSNTKRNISFFTGTSQYALHLVSFGLVTPMILLLYFANQKYVFSRYPAQACLCDYVDSLNGGYLVNLLLIPFSIVLIILISEQSNTSNYLLRQLSRSSLITKRYGRIVAASALFSLYLVAVSVPVAGLFTPNVMNWDECGSLFFAVRQYCLSMSFFAVIMITALRLFLTLLVYSSIVMALEQVMKKAYCFLVVIFLLGVRAFDFISNGVNIILSLPKMEESYMNAPSIILSFMVFPVIIAIAMAFSYHFIKRKDFLYK